MAEEFYRLGRRRR